MKLKILVLGMDFNEILSIFLLIVLISLFTLNYYKNKKDNKLLLDLIIKGIKLDHSTESLIDLSERIWRLKEIIYQYDRETDKKINRQFDRIERLLKSEYALETIDYTGRKYNNQNVKIESITPNKDIDKKIIYKTLKPEIQHKGNVIKKSHVEIHEPINNEDIPKPLFSSPLDKNNDQTEKISKELQHEINEDKITSDNNDVEISTDKETLNKEGKFDKNKDEHQEILKEENKKHF